MPGPQATALTALHRRELAVVARVAADRAAAVARTATAADIDSWWTTRSPALEQLAVQSATSAATLTSRYLVRHAALEGVEVQPVPAGPTAERIAVSLHVTGPAAFKTAMRGGDAGVAARTMARRLAAAVQRLTLTGSRDTTTATIRSSDGRIAGYRRNTNSGPCAFCSMLASRGPVYSTATADFPAHDSCGCTAEPVYDTEPATASEIRLRNLWDASTDGLSGDKALAAFRRALTTAAPATGAPT